jgi:hypothetical protein
VTVKDFAVIENDAWMLLEDSDGYSMAKLPIPAAEASDVGYPIHLDGLVEIASGTYAAGNTTWVQTIPNDATDTVVLSDAWGSGAGTEYAATASGGVITVTGANLAAYKIYAGTQIPMNCELSRPYVRDNEGAVLDGTLQLHKLVVNHYNSGAYKVVVSQPGRTDREFTAPIDGIDEEGQSQFFITGLSDRTSVSIQNTSHLPVGISLVEWITTFPGRSG